ncbi:MAG: hypothetical protein LIO65_04355 [Odoribacter sp.]|nr:hypothetical protein [Odoribacter sp.]
MRGFTVELWDIYNFSKDATHNNSQVFNYKAHETGHFLDLSVAYTLQGNYPLRMAWATIIHGRDRGRYNHKNLYSNYISVDCPILQHTPVTLTGGMAAAFAFDKESGTSANFYGRHAGIVNINLVASKVVHFKNYNLPVSAMAMWNPTNNNANLQLALNIF